MNGWVSYECLWRPRRSLWALVDTVLAWAARSFPAAHSGPPCSSWAHWAVTLSLSSCLFSGASLLSEVGVQVMCNWKSRRLNFVWFIDQGKPREAGEAVVWVIPGLELLVTNLDINRLGTLMHKLTHPHRVFWWGGSYMAHTELPSVAGSSGSSSQEYRGAGLAW